MNYPIYIRDYINDATIWFLIGFLLMVIFIVALYFDFWLKDPQTKKIAIKLNKDIYSAIRESLNEKVSTNFIGSILSKEAYEEKYSVENQAIATKEFLENNPYKLKPGFERPKSEWVNSAFQSYKKTDNSKKQVRVPYRLPYIEKLSVDESREINIGSMELVKVKQ